VGVQLFDTDRSRGETDWRGMLRAYYADLQRLIGTARTRVDLEGAITVMAACQQCSARTKADFIDALCAIDRELLGA
jgi:hypothetical protein